MTKTHPPVILSTIVASLVLSLALIFITGTNPIPEVFAAVSPENTPAITTSQSGLVNTPVATDSPNKTAGSTSYQSLIPDQPTSSQVTAPDAQTANSSSVDFNSFIDQVKNGQSNEMRGVYVQDLFALRVVTQPPGDVGYVSTDPGTATQFQLTAPGVTGLLAHNVLDGAKFLELKPGQEIRLVYGDGSVRRYQVEGLREFERLDRSNLHSDFIETETGTKMTSQEVFNWFYTGNPHLTLQTCVAKNGIEDWGVRFIVARPIA